MKVGIWGSGNLGTGLAYRLASAPYVSELFWTNRTYDRIELKIIDLQHGLAFAPSCRAVHGLTQERVNQMLMQIDALVLTLGNPVKQGETRGQKYKGNSEIFRKDVIPQLKGFKGVVVVITNPVDLIARLVFKEAGLNSSKIVGLGTVVETARLRASLGAYLSPIRPARDVWAYALGTHDEDFIPVVNRGLAIGDFTNGAELKDIVGFAKKEVVNAAARVKTPTGSSMYPIIEGVAAILESIALDQQRVLTVSVLDPKTPDHLFYSVPCRLGSQGVCWECRSHTPEVENALANCSDSLRKVLADAGET